MPIPICPAELLTLAGADAAAFAQGQFTSDVTALAPGDWQWSAWLDPQGRVRFFFALWRIAPDRFMAWLPLGGALPMREALGRFVMRAAVKLEALTDWTLHRRHAPTLSPHEVVACDGGFAFTQPAASHRGAWIAPVGAVSVDSAALERWRLDDIAAGLPLLVPELGGVFVAQAIGLERIDAIRFDKGCYPGQEIVARLHFRGGNKRHLHRLSIEGPVPAPGAAIVDGAGRSVGQVLYAARASSMASEALGVLANVGEAATLMTGAGQAVNVGAPCA